MITVRQTERYAQWFAGLRDHRAKGRIDARVRRVSLGKFGDVKSLKDGVSELRVDYGAGYRVYFARQGREIVILLGGGDKSTQARDIADAKALARQIEE